MTALTPLRDAQAAPAAAYCEKCGAELYGDERGLCPECRENEHGNALIQVTRLPVIEEQLRSMKDQIEREVEQALSLVCTEETIPAVKSARAKLNKQFKELEEQRSAAKKSVMEPWERFDAVYKECVTGPFKSADAALKDKITDVEGDMKRRCESGLREYFAELCAAEHVEWLEYERAGVIIDMASAKAKTPKRLREQVTDFVTQVARGVDLIADMDDAEEIMVEFRRSLDAAQAIGAVQDRHRRIAAERAARESREAECSREAEAVKMVEAAAPPTVMEPPVQQEKTYRCSFSVTATKAQLKKLKEFLIQEGIQFDTPHG